MGKQAKITRAEARAIKALQYTASIWPKTIKLFSWSGTLRVLKPGEGRTFHEASIAVVSIPNDGGDPPAYEEAF